MAKQENIFEHQLDHEGRIDHENGTLGLAVVSDDAPNGVMVKMSKNFHSTILNAAFGHDEGLSKLLNVKMYELTDYIQSVKCIDGNTELIDPNNPHELDPNITRSIQYAIAQLQLELAKSMNGDNAELVRELEEHHSYIFNYNEGSEDSEDLEDLEDLEESEESEE